MTTPELLAALRSWLRAVVPELLPSHLTVHFFNSAVPLTLPFAPETAPAREEGDERGRGLSPCVLDILKVLREAGHPLSRTRILEEMARRGIEWSDRAVAGHLARLVEDGTLLNPADVHPRGYRIASESEE